MNRDQIITALEALAVTTKDTHEAILLESALDYIYKLEKRLDYCEKKLIGTVIRAKREGTA